MEVARLLTVLTNGILSMLEDRGALTTRYQVLQHGHSDYWSMFMRNQRIAVVLFCLLSAACTYHGALREDFHSPAASVQATQKLPLKAVLLVEAKNIQVTGAFGIGVDISLRPGLNRAIQSELAKVFEASTLAETTENAREGDIIVHATLHHKVFVDHWTGIATANWELQLNFRDPLQKIPVSTLMSKGQTVVPPSGETTLASAVTGLCLFICLPLTAPWMAQAGGTHAIEVIEGELAEELRKLPDAIRNDHKILAYARGENADSATVVLPVIPQNKMRAVSSDVDSIPKLWRPRRHAHAIVIGIEEYQQKLPKADFAAHDARIVGQYLTKALGYPEENVVVLLNDQATKTSIEKFVEGWLANRAEKDDSVLIYFSGHGAPNPKTRHAYLVPYDGDPAFVEQTGYPLERLYDRLAALPAKEVVVVLDSCFSGAGGRSVIAKGMRPIVTEVENPMLANGRAVVLAASTGQQVSSTYDTKGHGLLTYFFLKGLQGEGDTNKDGAIELTELFSYLKPQVERIARREFNNDQTPQLLGSATALERGIRLAEQARP